MNEAQTSKLFDIFDRDGSGEISYDEFLRMVRGEMNRLKRDIRANISKAPNTTTRYHLQDAIARIDKSLDPK